MCINEHELDQFNELKQDIEDDVVTKESVNSIVKSILMNRGRFGGIVDKVVFIKFFFLSLCTCLIKKDK